ncbi:MAG: DUF898 family protein [Rhodospirillales bacterium]|nr:DUF898 family protein [Rhodospirillales bacterium]
MDMPAPETRLVPDVGPPAETTASFTDKGRLFRLLLKNAALTAVTLSFYRFWARTALRRYFWGNVAVAGEPLEYTGRGMELFIGFLINIALFALPATILSLLKFIDLVSPLVEGLGQLLSLVLFVLFVHFARFRAWRYRMSRTLWRGIRFGQDGAGWRYALLALGCYIVAGLTLGLATPWKRIVLQRYRIAHSRFGDRRFEFSASSLRLFAAWLIPYCITFFSLIAFSAANADVFTDFAKAVEAGAPEEVLRLHLDLALTKLRFYWLLALGLVGAAITYGWYRVFELRYFARCTRLGDTAFRSTINGGAISAIIVGFVFILVVLLVVAVLGSNVISFLFALLFPAGGVSDLVIAVYFVVFMWVAYYATSYIWLKRELAQHFWNNLHIANLAAVESVVQSAAQQPKFGEGLADSYDVGAV